MTLARKLAVALIAVMLVGGFAMIGGAADVTVHNTTVSITEDTDTVWVEVNNTHDTNQANLTATVTALDADGNETSTTENLTFNIASGTTDIQETSLTFDTENETDASVVVTLDNTTVSESDVSVSSGTFEKIDGTGGGGFDLGGLSTTEMGIIAALVVVGAIFMSED